MGNSDASRFARLAETVSDPELRAFYRGKVNELQKASPEAQQLTRQYVAKLRQLGVELPDKVTVSIEAQE